MLSVDPADTPAAIDPKALEILDRIKGVFAAKGFDGASMQALARAAGMSAGNFYRYFPSKDAIVEAMVEHDLAEVQGEFAAIMTSASPRVALRDTILRHIEGKGADDGPLWAEIEAASARRAEIARLSDRLESVVSRCLVRVFARIAALGEDEAQRRFAPHAALLVLLVKGLAMRCGGPRPIADPALRALAMRVVDRVLDEVAGAGAAERSLDAALDAALHPVVPSPAREA